MFMHTLHRCLSFLVGVLLGITVTTAVAQLGAGDRAAPTDPAVLLVARHAALPDELAHSPFPLPLVVRSREDGALAEGEIAGLVPHPFARFAATVGTPRAFCEVAVLHPNVKGCTHARGAAGDEVVLRAGRKHYESAERVHAQTFFATATRMGERYLQVELRAPQGPLDTRDYVFTLEAMPAGEATFIVVRYAYRSSFASRAATAGYLATAGSGKTGFSLEDGPAGRRPARGVRGVVERNAMRHYLALVAVLDTGDLPDATRTAARLDLYYTLTDRFAAQLREFDRAEYIAIKTREMTEQGMRIATGP